MAVGARPSGHRGVRAGLTETGRLPRSPEPHMRDGRACIGGSGRPVPRGAGPPRPARAGAASPRGPGARGARVSPSLGGPLGQIGQLERLHADPAPVGLRWGVLLRVGARILNLVADTEHLQRLQGEEGHDAEEAHPQGDQDDGDDLGPELVAAVEDAVAAVALLLVPEEADREDPPEAAGAVHGEGVHDVVDPKLLEEHRRSLVDEPADEPDDEGLPGLDEGAPRGDGDQAREHAVAETAHVELLGLERKSPQGEDHQPRNAWRDRRVHGHESRLVRRRCGVHGEGAPWVEAVPPEPEDEGPEDAERDVVRVELPLLGLIEAPRAGADDERTAECPEPTHHVDNAAPREVLERGAPEHRHGLAVAVRVRQHPRPAPAPVDHDWVDPASDHDRVDCEA
mmetsp:Transcript_123331/g.349438  ORF Transcript_123331/g.349438 Transcript_123331/m.349438 type:complete len:398 (-) Transcript_123331:498-1691(-)